MDIAAAESKALTFAFRNKERKLTQQEVAETLFKNISTLLSHAIAFEVF
jgi:hypothetical protein